MGLSPTVRAPASLAVREQVFVHLSRSMAFKLIGSGILATIMVLSAAPVRAQSVGPITPPPSFEVKKIPAKPEPPPPPLPADEIIHRFTQNEDLNKKLYDADMLDQTVRVEELASGGGTYELTSQEYTKSDGERYESVLKAPASDLHYTEFSLEDVKFLAGLQLFFLTTENLPEYKLSYEGKEKLDQITTYAFRVQPKQLLSKPLFDGVVWIDDQDFSIVKSYGQFLTDTGNFAASFPFQMFEVYRENIQGRLWLPTYIRSDSEVKAQQGTVPIRLIVRSSNFRPNTIPANAASAKPSAH